MLRRMPIYVVTGFQNSTFRTIETKKATVGEAIAHAESLGIEPETIRCAATREVFRKEGKEWTVDKYLPPKKLSEPGEFNVLYLVSFFVPPVGLVWGGIRAACGMNGGVGALIAAGFGIVAWGVGYVVASKYL